MAREPADILAEPEASPRPNRSHRRADAAQAREIEVTLSCPIEVGGGERPIAAVTLRRLNLGDLLELGDRLPTGPEVDVPLSLLLELLERLLIIDGSIFGEPVHERLFSKIDATDIDALTEALGKLFPAARGRGGKTQQRSRGRSGSAKASF